jgi:hypothetical protein
MDSDFNLQSLLHLKQMREEALNLYDYCLTEGSAAPLVEFIETQIALDPPPLLLLYEISDDIQQRMLILHDNHFDVRHQVMRAVKNLYEADTSQIFSPVQMENYHLMDVNEVIEGLTAQGIEIADEEIVLLVNLLRKSRDTATQLQKDILMTEGLQLLVHDWLKALTVTIARDYYQPYLTDPFNTGSFLH